MAMHYSSNKGLLAKQTAHPPSAAFHAHTHSHKGENRKQPPSGHTHKIDSAGHVVCDTLHWLGVRVRVGGVRCGNRRSTTVFINHCHTGKVANRMKERETQTTMLSGFSCPT